VDEGPSLVEPPFVSREIPTPAGSLRETETVSYHRRLKELVAEVGRLQRFHSQLEFPIPLEGRGRSLDVVWKRQARGVPTFAFEIELSGAVERAVLRFEFAHDRWQSRPRTVAPPDRHAEIRDIPPVQEAALARRARVCTDGQMYDLGRRKRELRTLEEQLGIS
jgi:hypothetical protein